MSLLEKEDVEEIAKVVFEEETFEKLNYEIVCKAEGVLGHLGNHLALLFKVFSKEKANKRMAFVKTYGLEAEEENFVGKAGIFEKEVDVYKVLIEDIRRFVGEPGWCPRYYFSKPKVLGKYQSLSILQSKNLALKVLEDLSERGFRVASQKMTLDEKHLKVALRALSSMHASSFFLEKKKSCPLNSAYPNVFKELLYDENEPGAPSRTWLLEQTQDLLIGIDYLSKYSPEEKSEIRTRFPEEIMRIYSLSKPSKKYQNLFVHGDVWSNNLLFRYSNNVPVECKFVDFQFSRYAPPAHDVMHLLFYATKKDTRDNREISLLRFYFENLMERSKLDNEGPGLDMTWEEFLKSCKEYKELALIQCLVSLHYLLGPASASNYENVRSNDRTEYVQRLFTTNSYAEKITEIFDELITGYILG